MTLSSLQKVYKILDVFGTADAELRVTDISRQTGLDKSTVSRILASLSSAGYLEKNESNKTYSLSWKWLKLGNAVMSRYVDIRVAAIPFLDELAKQTDEIVHLGVLDKTEVVSLEKRGRSRALTIGTQVGGRAPVHGSSLGKILISNMTEEELIGTFGRTPFVRLTNKTISNISELLKEVKKIKKQGFAFDDGECHEGVQCLAAPIKDNSGAIIAAISVSVPKQRMSRTRKEEIRVLVLQAAESISQRICMKSF
jgi:IclR family transcriptional regulator, KDG regulon repressor